MGVFAAAANHKQVAAQHEQGAYQNELIIFFSKSMRMGHIFSLGIWFRAQK